MISSHGLPCPFVKYLSRTRSRHCVQVRKCLRTCPRTNVRMHADSSLPLTISKCSVSMWKYAVTKERIFYFVIYRHFRSYSPFLNVPNALDHVALSHSLSLSLGNFMLSIKFYLFYFHLFILFFYFIIFFLFVFLIFCTPFCTL